MTPPTWATRLLVTVWQAETPAGTTPPTLRWRKSRHIYSSGKGSLLRLTVTAGLVRNDQRLVLLHELAHALRQHEAQAAGLPFAVVGHDSRYWQIAWHLYRTYRGSLTLATILQREQGYKVGALTAAADAGIPGARRAVALRRRSKEYTPVATQTVELPAGTKLCPGIPSLGEPAHVAPFDAFGKNKAHADGYTRHCLAHGRQYQQAWVAAKKAAAAGEVVPAKTTSKQAKATPAPKPTTKKAGRKAKSAPVVEAVPDLDGETPEVTARRSRTLAAVEAVGAETDEGQALLAAAADEAKAAQRATWRAAKAAQRAAKKAAAQA